jgi:hypothetical protein
MSTQKGKQSNKSKKKTQQPRKPSPSKSTKQGRQQYNVETAPVSIGNRTYMTRPKITRRGDSEIYTHSEYIADIVGSSTNFLVARTLPLNPGLSTVFPWLHSIANRYESYRFRKLNFRFMTERPTTESGYIALIPDYDAADTAPSNKTTAFQYQGAAKCAPWENMTQVNSPSNLSKRREYFTRKGALPASGPSIQLYDTGNLFVIVGGNSGAVNLGELWCDYEVELWTPQVDGDASDADSAKVGSTGVLETALLPFGPAPLLTFSRENMFNYDPVTGVFTFLRPYQGLFQYDVTGSGITVLDVTGTADITPPTFAVNAGGTFLCGRQLIRADEGETFDPVVTGAAAISQVNLRIGAYAWTLQ